MFFLIKRKFDEKCLVKVIWGRLNVGQTNIDQENFVKKLAKRNHFVRKNYDTVVEGPHV